jgi:hypothetical protein
MQWVLLYLSIGHDIENISHSAAKMNDNWTSHDSIFSAITHKLNVSGHMLIWTFFLVLVCGTRAQNLSAPFSYTIYVTIWWLKNCKGCGRKESWSIWSTVPVFGWSGWGKPQQSSVTGPDVPTQMRTGHVRLGQISSVIYVAYYYQVNPEGTKKFFHVKPTSRERFYTLHKYRSRAIFLLSCLGVKELDTKVYINWK